MSTAKPKQIQYLLMDLDSMNGSTQSQPGSIFVFVLLTGEGVVFFVPPPTVPPSLSPFIFLKKKKLRSEGPPPSL